MLINQSVTLIWFSLKSSPYAYDEIKAIQYDNPKNSESPKFSRGIIELGVKVINKKVDDNTIIPLEKGGPPEKKKDVKNRKQYMSYDKKGNNILIQYRIYLPKTNSYIYYNEDDSIK